jgi:hypothetical protein
MRAIRIDSVVFALLILLLSPISANAQDSVDCFHDDWAEGREDWAHGSIVSPAQDCALVSDSELVRFTPELLAGTHYDEDGLSCVLLAQGLGANLVREDGRFARVPYWDNKCAWFMEGLSVTQLDGRQAYIDKNFNVVLDPGFELLSPFGESAYAKVCNGPFVFVERGDLIRTGGKCGVIDRSGELVMDLLYPFEDTAAMWEVFRNAQSEQGDFDEPTN